MTVAKDRIDIRSPRAVVFDWDNTLVDTWHQIGAALNHTLTAMGYDPWTPAEIRARVRASAREAFPALFGDRAAEAMALFYKAFEADHLERLKILPGRAALLERLGAAGLVQTIVSNKRGKIVRLEADHLGWSDHFHCIVGADDAARDKPAPDPVALSLEGSGLELGPEVWFVGDTDIDMVCAVNAGCLPVLLRDAAPEMGEFPEAAPALHFATSEALADRLLNT